jgi:DNA-binding response OmpR family regulator
MEKYTRPAKAKITALALAMIATGGAVGMTTTPHTVSAETRGVSIANHQGSRDLPEQIVETLEDEETDGQEEAPSTEWSHMGNILLRFGKTPLSGVLLVGSVPATIGWVIPTRSKKEYDWGMHVVIVEDNLVLAKSLLRVFAQEGYISTHFSDGIEAEDWLLLNDGSYDLVILDILLPGIDGLTLCRHLREAKMKTPVLMLTSKDTVSDTIEGLEQGADDYLKKPFEVDELLARMRSLLRRPPLSVNTLTDVLPGIVLDMRSQSVTTRDGERIPLTTKEFSIFAYFVSRPGEIVNQQQIYDHVFDFAEVQLSNAVEVHIKNIRKKFKAVNYEIPLTTIRGAGYRLDL